MMQSSGHSTYMQFLKDKSQIICREFSNFIIAYFWTSRRGVCFWAHKPTHFIQIVLKRKVEAPMPSISVVVWNRIFNVIYQHDWLGCGSVIIKIYFNQWIIVKLIYRILLICPCITSIINMSWKVVPRLSQLKVYFCTKV